MGIQIPQTKIATPVKKQRGHTLPRRPLISLDEPGRLRVGNLLVIFNISHTKLYADLPRKGSPGRYPAPDGNDGRPYWNTSTIKSFLAAC